MRRNPSFGDVLLAVVPRLIVLGVLAFLLFQLWHGRIENKTFVVAFLVVEFLAGVMHHASEE